MTFGRQHRGRFYPFALLLLFLMQPHGVGFASERTVTAYLFWHPGCPHCAMAKTALHGLAQSTRNVRLEALELDRATATDELYLKLIKHFGYDRAAIPLVIIGDRSFLGFLDGHSAQQYKRAAEACIAQSCPEVVAQARAASAVTLPPSSRGEIRDRALRAPAMGATSDRALPEFLQLPLLGKIRTADLSLPVLTVALAAIDGFNPCAMWVLVFLIGLLMGLRDEKRMWLLGGAFLLATAVMYFAVMAAWLNVVLVLGTTKWVRYGVAVLALGGGFFYLREYWTKPDLVCAVTSPGRRQRIMSAFRSVVTEHRLPLAVIGIMGLAVLVNFIELLCSVGIPAVYTQVLALNNLPRATYYAFLALYILIFLLDDAVIFASAMVALRVTGLTGSYARYSHLIGGVMLLVIGAVMMLRPELLTYT